MSEPPVYTPPQQNAAYPPPQGQQVVYQQGQPGAGQAVVYPPGGAAYPQGQPVVYQQGQAQGVVYQQGQVYPPGQQTVITTSGPTTHVYTTGSSQGTCGSTYAEHYKEKAGFATGVVHLIVGILCIILGGAAYAFPVIQVGYGIWSSIIFYIPTGILGVCSKRKNSCVIIAYMVMAILSVLHAIGMLAYEALVAAVFTWVSNCYFSFIGYESTLHCNDERSIGAVVVHSLLAFLALVEIIVSIVAAAYCCGGLSCCCAPPPTNQQTTSSTTVQYQYGQQQAQPMTVTQQKYAPGPEGGQ